MKLIGNALQGVEESGNSLLEEMLFHRVILREQKRTERSGTPMVLMLLDSGSEAWEHGTAGILKDIARFLIDATRETDTVGWYKGNSVLGVVFTDVPKEALDAILAVIQRRISAALASVLNPDRLRCIQVSFHVFPDRDGRDVTEETRNPLLYPDHMVNRKRKPLVRILKRVLDIVLVSFGLILCSPLFLLISAVVKLSSSGPVFYRQERIGQNGIPFVFLKFRSMYVDNDPKAHKEYVHKMIAGNAKPCEDNGAAIYKLTTDSRITRVGAFLRKSSLDELPQLLNVLRGEMSLVGPRPPIAYEVEAYQLWHRRRISETKPGITGLWQVSGRSRIKFDDMVRLDLAYAKNWSLWLDIKILLRTPGAVLQGSH